MLLSEILATLQPAESGHTVTVTTDWGQGRATYGGLVAAVGNEAMRQRVAAERPLRSLQTTFIGPAPAGILSMKTRVLRVGKAVTLTSCDIFDGEQIVAYDNNPSDVADVNGRQLAAFAGFPLS
jgi:acyl-CoA thioesterase